MRAVLLDALGTLLRLEPPAPALRDELAARGVEVDEPTAQAAIAAEIAYYRSHHLEGGDRARLAGLRRRCARVLRDGLGAAGAALAVEDVEGALLASLRFRAYPDALPALARLRSDGARLVVVSNWDVSLPDRLAEVGLAACVDGAVASAEVGAAKPAREVFDRALALAGASPAEAVHVGDSLVEDVAGARAAGIEPVLLVRHGEVSGDESLRVVRSLEAVAAPAR